LSLFHNGEILLFLISPRGTRGRIAFVAAIFASILIGGSAFAQVKPGDLITAETATKVKELLPPGVF
jgi:hypothetical protein